MAHPGHRNIGAEIANGGDNAPDRRFSNAIWALVLAFLAISWIVSMVSG